MIKKLLDNLLNRKTIIVADLETRLRPEYKIDTNKMHEILKPYYKVERIDGKLVYTLTVVDKKGDF